SRRHLRLPGFPAVDARRPGGGWQSNAMPVRPKMLRLGAALLVAAAAALPSTTMAFAASPYDGRWSVVIQTDRGACDRAYRYGIAIQNGHVGYAGDNSFNVSGQVGRNGAVSVRVSRGGSYAAGTGRLSGSSGSGTWRGVGSGVCSGRWFAE